MKFTITCDVDCRNTKNGKSIMIDDEIKQIINDELKMKIEDIWSDTICNDQIIDIHISFDNIKLA